MSEPIYVAKTLEWCNERRQERGMEPMDRLPKGKRSDGSSCPCGKATGLFVGHSRYYESVEARLPLGDVPMDVSDFVSEFDVGNLPQYEE